MDIEMNVELDESNLLASSYEKINEEELKKDKEIYLQQMTLLSTKTLLNSLNRLPKETNSDNLTIINLPFSLSTTKIPRAKRLPMKKTETKWEKFAREKGLKKTKKSKMVWNEEKKEWLPRFGGRSEKNQNEIWIKELKDNEMASDSNFTEEKRLKKERVAKNEFQRLRNIERNSNKSLSGLPALVTDKNDIVPDSSALVMKKRLDVARRSDASLGKFSKEISKKEEKLVHGIRPKQKHLTTSIDETQEKRLTSKIVKKVLENSQNLNMEQGTNQMMERENLLESFNPKNKSKTFKMKGKAKFDLKKSMKNRKQMRKQKGRKGQK
ncbi:hypothetical protein SNEBB_003862 [Seison nebaliae]|nr:hypothetical protein SNEBB_003862 [Seison nebaliae]